MVIYNYENTSRLVDIPSTVFTHLCMEINTAWDLDGNSLIEECMISGTTDVSADINLSVFPNPAKNFMTIRANAKIKSVQVTDINSHYQRSIETNHASDYTLFTEDLKAGMYFLQVHFESGKSKAVKVIVVK